MEHASWQGEGLWQNQDRVRIVNKFLSMYLFGVKIVASCFLMCLVGYGMRSSWEPCKCKWQFVSSTHCGALLPGRPKAVSESGQQRQQVCQFAPVWHHTCCNSLIQIQCMIWGRFKLEYLNCKWPFVSSGQCNLERASWQADGCRKLWPTTSPSLSACTCLALNLLQGVEQSVLMDLSWMRVGRCVSSRGHSCQVGQCELERFHLFGSCEVVSADAKMSAFG